MAKDGGDFIASKAFYIHEIGIGALHQALLLVFPLLLFWRAMKKILCERHVLVRRSSPLERLSINFKVLFFCVLRSLINMKYFFAYGLKFDPVFLNIQLS